jgi:hypothetical protein
MYYVDLKILGGFLDLANVPLIVLIAVACSHVFSEINIKIIDNVGESSKLCKKALIRSDRGDLRQAIRDGSLISSPSGVPTKVNFLLAESLISELYSQKINNASSMNLTCEHDSLNIHLRLVRW